MRQSVSTPSIAGAARVGRLATSLMHRSIDQFMAPIIASANTGLKVPFVVRFDKIATLVWVLYKQNLLVRSHAFQAAH